MSRISAGTRERERHGLAGAGQLERVDERRGSRVRLRLHPAEREDAADDVAQVLGGRVVARFGAEGAR